MTNENYKRGQIFGFTIAESILLVVFILLLLLAGRLVAIQKEKKIIQREKEIVEAEVGKVREALAVVSGENESDKIFVLLDRWKKGVESQISQLPGEVVTYREFKELLQLVADRIGLDGKPEEQVRKVTELLAVADKGKQLGLTARTSVSDLETYRAAIQDRSKLDKALMTNQLKACKAESASLKSQLARTTEEGEFCQKEVRRLTGGYGLPPCWIDPKSHDGVITFSVEIRDNDMLVKPASSMTDYVNQPAYKEIMMTESLWGRRLSSAEFRDMLAGLKAASRQSKNNACDIWVQVEDCVSNDKLAYKARVGDVGLIFRNKRGIACSVSTR